VCSAGERRVGCINTGTIAYHTFETALLNASLHLAMDDQTFSDRSELARVNTLIAERRRALDIATAKAERLWSAWADDGSETARQLAKKAEGEADELRANLVALEQQRDNASGRASSAEHLQRVADIQANLYHPDLSVRVPLRRKVAQALSSLIARIEYDGDHMSVYAAKGALTLKIDRKGDVVMAADFVPSNELADYKRRRASTLAEAGKDAERNQIKVKLVKRDK